MHPHLSFMSGASRSRPGPLPTEPGLCARHQWPRRNSRTLRGGGGDGGVAGGEWEGHLQLSPGATKG